MKNISVQLVPLGKEIRAREGTPLIDILHEYGVEFPCGGKGTCGKCRVKVLEGKLEADSQHLAKLRELDLGTDWRLACRSSCQENLVLEVGQYHSIIKADETTFDFTPRKGFGVAFDLGTTTLVGQLLDLQTGEILGVEKALNPQKKFGSDLVSRLEAALAGHYQEMVDLIREKIGQMIRDMTGGRCEKIQEISIVGNTVMQHFFCALDIRPLSFFPFESPDLAARVIKPEELGWNISCPNIRFHASIGSFVGSDILAGILATGMHQKEAYTVLVDLGTNGELVVGNKKQLLCASTAAGPAFEGARISMGMQAVTGAISSVKAGEGDWKYSVIGKVAPRGICGSGLIDVISLLLDAAKLGEFGEIQSGEDQVPLTGGVVLTQKDIQEFQLGKSAIATGLEILMRRMGIGSEDIDRIYIAGGFGSYLNTSHVKRTGMLDVDPEKMHQLGNSALIGAKMMLFTNAGEVDRILSLTSHVNLESEPDFQDRYVEHLAFPQHGA